MAIMDIASILQRIKELRSFRFDREVAQLFSLTSTDFSNRKREEPFFPVIIEWAEKEGVRFAMVVVRGIRKHFCRLCDNKPISLTFEEAEALIMLRRMEKENETNC